AGVQEQFFMEFQVRRNLVGHGLGRVIMPEVETEHEIAAQRVIGIKLLRTDDKGFAAQTEELALDRIDAKRPVDQLVGKDRIVGRGETRPETETVAWFILRA